MPCTPATRGSARCGRRWRGGSVVRSRSRTGTSSSFTGCTGPLPAPARGSPGRAPSTSRWTGSSPPTEPMDRFVPAYRSNLMPRLEELPGFCSLSLLVDPQGGRAVGVESFENRETLEHTRGEARALREEFSSAMGAQVTEVAEMDLVLAHLRVPETV